jgi:hypothetical protein
VTRQLLFSLLFVLYVICFQLCFCFVSVFCCYLFASLASFCCVRGVIGDRGSGVEITNENGRSFAGLPQ